ncbi:MAG TPA: hypothetical protein VM597_28140 [Gemmataceae bacterium]|jgi:hypothetical protein|nr:hypothetical protein [Gemmataceae bacterium]
MPRGPKAHGRTKAASYYYAGGKKIELAPADDLVALDGRGLAKVSAEAREVVERAGRPLSEGIHLVEKAFLGDDAEVAAAGRLYPVFRSRGAVIVALPEVRIEDSRVGYQKKIGSWLRSHAGEAVVEKHSADRVDVRPASGGDALGIANALAEEVGPEMAQVRFLRVTGRPV